MQKALLIISNMDLGGAETFIMKMLRVFPEGYQLDFCLSSKGYYDDQLKKIGSEIFYIPLKSKHPLGYYRAVKDIIKEKQYKNVLLTPSTASCVVEAFAARRGGANNICVRSANSKTNGRKRIFFHYFFRPFLRRLASVCVAPSTIAAEFMFGKRYISKKGFVFLKNAINFDDFKFNETNRISLREEFHLNETDIILGHVGSFKPEKNQVFLIEVLRLLLESNQKFKLIFVGNKRREFNRVKALVDQYNLGDHVIFTGSRNDAAKFYSVFDFFVLPSVFEGMPNVLIEAQASGLKCFSSETVTKEANITGLVSYLPINKPSIWSDCILNEEKGRSFDTFECFKSHGYLIEETVKKMIDILYK